MRYLTAVAALTFLVACPEPPAVLAPDSGAVEPDAGVSLVEVEISRIDEWRHDQGTTQVPGSFDDVAAFYETANGLEPATLQPRDAGLAVVLRPSNVPLHLRTTDSYGKRKWQVTSATRIDLGRNLMGRYGAPSAAAGTKLQIEWTSDKQLPLHLFSSGARLWGQYAVPMPAVGETAPYMAEVDYAALTSYGATPGLVQTGDTLYLYQLGPGSADTPAAQNLVFTGLIRAAKVDTVQMQDGQTTQVTVALVQDDYRELRFNSDLAALAALTGKALPADQGTKARVSVWVSPHSTTSGAFLMFAEPSAGDFPFSAFFWTPFPTDWPLTQIMDWSASVDGVDYFAEFQALAVHGATIDWMPKVAPVADLQVDGNSALMANTTSASPHITWSAPQDGADYYAVWVYDAAGKAVEGFYTRETSLKVPAGSITSGQQWRVSVIAVRSAQGFEQRPVPGAAIASYGIRGAMLTAQ